VACWDGRCARKLNGANRHGNILDGEQKAGKALAHDLCKRQRIPVTWNSVGANHVSKRGANLIHGLSSFRDCAGVKRNAGPQGLIQLLIGKPDKIIKTAREHVLCFRYLEFDGELSLVGGVAEGNVLECAGVCQAVRSTPQLCLADYIADAEPR